MNEFRRCTMCGILCLKTNFHRDNKRKDGVQRLCIICTIQYHTNRKERRKPLERQKRKTDFIFKIICNIRTKLTKLSNLKILQKNK